LSCACEPCLLGSTTRRQLNGEVKNRPPLSVQTRPFLLQRTAPFSSTNRDGARHFDHPVLPIVDLSPQEVGVLLGGRTASARHSTRLDAPSRIARIALRSGY